MTHQGFEVVEVEVHGTRKANVRIFIHGPQSVFAVLLAKKWP